MSNTNTIDHLKAFINFSFHSIHDPEKKMEGNVVFLAADEKCNLSKIGNTWHLKIHTSHKERFNILTSPCLIFYLHESSYLRNLIDLYAYNIRKLLHKEQNTLLIELRDINPFYKPTIQYPLILNVKFDPYSNADINIYSYI